MFKHHDSSISAKHATFYLILALLIFKIIIVFSGLGLIVDAAHYALYAKYPALSYFDHPPMVGWLQILPLHMSSSDSMQMLMPILLSVILAMQIYAFTRLLFPNHSPWLAFLAVLVSQCEVMHFALSVGYTPQSPLLVFSIAFMHYFWKAITFDSSKSKTHKHSKHCWKFWRYSQWLLAGFFLGCAGLSDYTAIFLGVGAFIFLLIQMPQKLRSTGLWSAVILAIFLASPVFIWNAEHHWISFQYQLHHGFQSHGWQIKLFIRSQLIQLGCYNPFIYILGYYAIYQAIRHHCIQPNIRYLICFIMPVLLLFAYSSGYNLVRPHWPILAWTLIAVLLTYIIFPKLQQSRPWRITGYCTTGLSAFVIVIFTSLTIYPWLPVDYLHNPLHDVYGWRQASNFADKSLSKLPPQDQHLYVTNWSLASRLAWYSKKPVQVINTTALNQFDLWYGKPQQDANGIVVIPGGTSFTYGPNQKGTFNQCKLLHQMNVYRIKIRVNHFTFYYCQNYSPL